MLQCFLSFKKFSRLKVQRTARDTRNRADAPKSRENEVKTADEVAVCESAAVISKCLLHHAPNYQAVSPTSISCDF